MSRMNRQLALLSCWMSAITILVGAHDTGRPDSFLHHLIGWQSGIDLGSTFAGGMTFDAEHETVIITGSTYARGFFLPEVNWWTLDAPTNSDCFVMRVQLNRTAQLDPIKIADPTRMGRYQDIEGCATLQYLDDHHRVLLAGSTSAQAYGPTDVEGDVLPLQRDVDLMGQVASHTFDTVPYGEQPIMTQHYVFGGPGFYHARVNYPFAITSNYVQNVSDHATVAPRDQSVFVASMISPAIGYWSDPYAPLRHDTNASEPDLTHPYVEGNVWSLAVQKLNMVWSNATNETTILQHEMHLDRDWMQNYDTINYADLRGADLVHANGKLFLVGSTKDVNKSMFGAAQREYSAATDYDGFITQLSVSNGTVRDSLGAPYVLRLGTGAGADDIVWGTCLPPAGYSNGNVDYMFVVGGTTGLMDLSGRYGGGFVYKIDINTMNVTWALQLHGNLTNAGDMAAIDCVVTPDGQFVYVAGEIAHNSTIDGYNASMGGNDVFVSKLAASEGEIVWHLQLGSDKNESLARGGAIVLDHDWNVILYGNTRGSVGRGRADGLERADDTNDIFLLTITPDGYYLPPDPTYHFQVPADYWLTPGEMNWGMVGYVIAIAFVLLIALLLIYANWKRCNGYYRNRYGGSTRAVRGGGSSRQGSSSLDETRSLRSKSSKTSNRTTDITEREDDVSQTTGSLGPSVVRGDDHDVELGKSQAPTMDEINSLLHSNVDTSEPIDVTEGCDDEEDLVHVSGGAFWDNAEETKQEEESNPMNTFIKVAAPVAVAATSPLVTNVSQNTGTTHDASAAPRKAVWPPVTTPASPPVSARRPVWPPTSPTAASSSEGATTSSLSPFASPSTPKRVAAVWPPPSSSGTKSPAWSPLRPVVVPSSPPPSAAASEANEVGADSSGKTEAQLRMERMRAMFGG